MAHYSDSDAIGKTVCIFFKALLR